MKILIVFTGGTIGSAVNDGTIAPDSGMRYRLLENFKTANPDNDVTFVCKKPYTVLSENLTADHINQLIQCVRDHLSPEYDGIIVTHGTDTLQFAAGALHFAFSDIDIPLILVSSNLPLTEEGSNGDINFASAVEFIRQKSGKGVFVNYANYGENVKFHLASLVLMHQEASDGVFSLCDNYFASYSDGKIIKNPAYTKFSTAKAKRDFILAERSHVLVLNCYPGMSFNFNLDGFKAIIFRPYHSGTLNTADPEFISFCETLKKEKLPAFVVNTPRGNIYESSVAYKNLGLTDLPNSTFATIYMKLWIENS